MPALQTILGLLNTAFSESGIDALRRRANLFAPGNQLTAAARALKLVPKDGARARAWLAYLGSLPPGIHEAVRSVLYSALTTKPRDFTDCARMKALSDETLFGAIKNGGEAVKLSKDMPAWKDGMDDDEIHDLVAYLRGLCNK